MKHTFILLIISLSLYEATAQCELPIDPDICIEDGDLFIEGSCHGVVLTSPDGSCYRISVNNDGSLSTVAIIATDAGPDQEICADNPQVSLNGTLGNGILSATWNGGTGTFSPNRSSLNAIYSPSASEISTGFVNLTLSPDNVISSCDGDDVIRITIIPEISQFECFKLVQNIEDANPPSTTFNILDIVNISNNTCTGMPDLTAAFSADPNDTLRTFDCSDVGSFVLTIFIFDIGDSNLDGIIDTTFRENCVGPHTILDQAGFCNL